MACSSNAHSGFTSTGCTKSYLLVKSLLITIFSLILYSWLWILTKMLKNRIVTWMAWIQILWVWLACWLAAWSVSPPWHGLGGTIASYSVPFLQDWLLFSSSSTILCPERELDLGCDVAVLQNKTYVMIDRLVRHLSKSALLWDPWDFPDRHSKQLFTSFLSLFQLVIDVSL